MAERTLAVAGRHLRFRVSSVPREAAESFAAFAEALRAVPREPGGPPPAPPSIRDATLPNGLVERPLTESDLRQMVERELPTRPDHFPGSPNQAVPPHVRVVEGKRREAYYFDVADGDVLGHCIGTQRGGWRNALVEALAVKHLIDFDEDLFLRVANNDRSTWGD